MKKRGFVETLLKAAVVAALEPEKEWFTNRPAQVGAITKVLRTLRHDERKRFASPKGRDDFLWAALNYLAPLPHEELLVAIGSRRGNRRSSGAALRSVHRTVGTRASVTPTPFVRALVDAELEREGAEVILVHNHPSNVVKSALQLVVDWRPVPSDADRNLARALLGQRLEHVLTAARPSSLKWYLVDEGRLGEFFLPAADELLAWLR